PTIGADEEVRWNAASLSLPLLNCGCSTSLKREDHTPFELPKEIFDKCLAMMEILGITYGCFDFVIDKKGRFVFLEVNPSGQWLWIEDLTGLEISRRIALELARG
ncbi:hypothetical protein, partial [Deinococcus aetherius]|uniref:hypothetical protein n=1 Tax=Deinococcus aetherius TaxID=200252 RepID=UPI0031F0A7FF